MAVNHKVVNHATRGVVTGMDVARNRIGLPEAVGKAIEVGLPG